MPKRINLTGQRFGRLVARRPVVMPDGLSGWECDCDCGNTATVRTLSLTRPKKDFRGTQSCGCLHKLPGPEYHRHKQIACAVTEAEHAAIMEHCRRRNITASTIIRMMLWTMGLVEDDGYAEHLTGRRREPEPPRGPARTEVGPPPNGTT